MCGSRKYPYPPHGGSRNFLGVGGSKRDKFLKGRGVHKEFFFPEGLKCDRMNTYVFFQLIRGSQEKPKVLSVEIDVGFLVIYFLLLSRRQMTRTAPRHTSEHVRRRVKQNGWLEKYRSQSLTLAVLYRFLCSYEFGNVSKVDTMPFVLSIIFL